MFKKSPRAKSDILSGFIHLLGLLFALVGGGLLVWFSALENKPWHMVAFSIYTATLVMLFLSSTLYHMLPLSKKGIQRMRLIDHLMIYQMIAGTYTPICLISLRGVWGWSFFFLVWGLALLGTLFSLFWMEAPRWLSTALYLIMGWIAIAGIYPLVTMFPLGGLMWLFTGGIVYSLGAVVYARKKPNPFPSVFGFHEIWHIAVLGGTGAHFVMMALYVFPVA